MKPVKIKSKERSGNQHSVQEKAESHLSKISQFEQIY